MKKSRFFLLIFGFILFITVLALPTFANLTDPVYDPELVTVTCPDGRKFPNIKICFAGSTTCTPDPNPCDAK